MDHIAIDLGGKESQICVRNASGKILEERRWFTKDLEGVFKDRPQSRIVLETCSEAFHVANQALAHGHEVRVVPATLVKSLGVGARNLKTDIRDAQVLSEVSCRIDLPSVHIPEDESRRRKTLCGMRDQLVKSRTSLINCVRGFLRTLVFRIQSGRSETFPNRIRSAKIDIPPHVERLLVTIDHLTEQIKAATKELENIVETDALLGRLTTVPGVGTITAIQFGAVIDDISRFKDAHQLESYLGLVPGQRQSSNQQRMLGITKAGSKPLRRALIQAAWTAKRVAKLHPMVHWATTVEKRRGKVISTVALARKLAGILFAMWRDGTTYQASKGGRSFDATNNTAEFIM